VTPAAFSGRSRDVRDSDARGDTVVWAEEYLRRGPEKKPPGWQTDFRTWLAQVAIKLHAKNQQAAAEARAEAQGQAQVGSAAAQQSQSGPALHVANMVYQPPGTAAPLLDDVSMVLQPNQMGLIYGRSGSGKTSLLKIVAGLAQHNSGRVVVGAASQPVPQAVDPAVLSGNGAAPGMTATTSPTAGQKAEGMGAGDRAQAAGMVFQFPERHFLGSTIQEELVFGWPNRPDDGMARLALTMRTRAVLEAVGMQQVDMLASPASLSDGYKRRLALAVQLIRGPAVLLLDEPLAGLDWRARADVADLLGKLKQECTVLVVSHDLHELEQQVDTAWEMKSGGRLVPAVWPPPKDGPAAESNRAALAAHMASK